MPTTSSRNVLKRPRPHLFETRPLGRLFWLAILATVLSSSWGCKRIVEEAIKGAKRSIGSDGGAAIGSTHEVDEDQELGEKLNGYIRDCMNRFSKQIHLSEQRYYSWVDEKKGPTGKERNVGGLHEISSDPAQCKSAIAKSNAALTEEGRNREDG